MSRQPQSCRNLAATDPTGSTAASVATKASMVAMSGRIMPAPLAIPVTVTSRPPSVQSPRCPLGPGIGGHNAVRRHPTQPSGRNAASAAGKPAVSRPSGNGSPITPVENGSTSSRRQPACSAKASTGGLSIGQPLPAGAGVGVPGIDHQIARVARRPGGFAPPRPAQRRRHSG
jgi:hypothetical protein